MDKWKTIRQICPKLYRHGLNFECSTGWYDILYDLSIQLERIIEKHEEKYRVVEDNEYAEMYAVQVKEKYGTLRFYMACETEEIGALIKKAEALSSEICENCGSAGKIRGISWLSTRCDKCYEEKNG